MRDEATNPLEDTESHAARAYAEERRENIRTFVRTNPEYYIRNFDRIGAPARFTPTFNLFAGLFGPIWFGARGLWNWALPFLILEALALVQTRGVTADIRQGDVTTWDWGARPYDLVAGVFIQFFGAEGRARVFDGMKQAVAPGGLIALHGYTPKQLEYRTGGPGVLENLYTEDLLAEAFAGYEMLRLESYEAEIDEGAGHRGRSALIDMIARHPG